MILRDDVRTRSDGGIILPSTAELGARQTGTVIAVGPGNIVDGKRVPVELKEGDRVIIAGYAGLEIRDNNSGQRDDEYVIVREDDVLAVLPG